MIIPDKNIIISSNKKQDPTENVDNLIGAEKTMTLRLTQSEIDSFNDTLIVDTEKHLIYNGINEVNGRVLKEGDFFKLTTESQVGASSPEIITVYGEGITGAGEITIKYDYLYF